MAMSALLRQRGKLNCSLSMASSIFNTKSFNCHSKTQKQSIERDNTVIYLKSSDINAIIFFPNGVNNVKTLQHQLKGLSI